MTNNWVAVNNSNQAPLALRPRDAARALGISERSLEFDNPSRSDSLRAVWSWEASRGALPDR